MATVMIPLQINAVKTNTSAPAMGYVNRYDATAGDLAVTLPALSGLNVNARVMVQKYALDISVNTVTFTAAGADLFDDSTTSTALEESGQSCTLQVVSISGSKRWKIMESMLALADGGSATSLPIVTPEDFGAVGDAVTDDSAAIEDMFYNHATTNGGACILIPAGKTYLTDAFDIRSNTYVFGSGTLKCRSDLGGGGGPGAFALCNQGIHDVTWIGPTLDINGKVNVNGFDIGNADFDTTSPYIENVYIVSRVIGARIQVSPLGSGPGATAGEDYTNRLFAGGGKGMSLGFRVRNCYVNLRTYDCDIGASIESTDDNNRPVENVVVDLQCYNSHRTALLVSGGLDGITSSLDSGSYIHSQYPGAKIRLSAQGGQDASVIHPVSGSTLTNYDTVGVVTMNYASAIDLELKVATQNRCTLIRGMANASTFRINATMDDLEDVWNTNFVDTLDPGLTFMPDNKLIADVHAATHHGVVVRPHRSGANRTMVKTRLEANMWCANGVGLITQSDGTTDSFGASVSYQFRDMRSDPVKEVVGISSYNPLPNWSNIRHFDNLSAVNFVPDRTSTTTSAGTTTLISTSTQVQVFTGGSNQTVKLPTTGVTAGQAWTIINNSTGVVSVQASNGSALLSMLPGKAAAFVTLIDTPTTPSDWQLTGFAIKSTSSSSSIALRDTDGNLFANNFITDADSTANAGGTTTLTISDARIHVFTGSGNQTVKLPTTSVVAGQTYTLINNSTGVISVQASGGSALFSMFPSKTAAFTALIDTPTTPSNWQLTSLTATTTDTGSTIAIRDTDHSLFASNFITTPYSTTTAAGTTTLTISDGQVQIFTGASTQTVKLPSGSVTAGMQYTIVNNSTGGSVTVQSSGANTIATVLSNTVQLFIALINNPTTAAHWRAI